MKNRLVVLISFLLVCALAACQSRTPIPASPTVTPAPSVAAALTIAPTKTPAPVPDTITPVPAPTHTSKPTVTPLPAEFVWKMNGAPEPFNAPVGFALDTQGNFYVMDTKNAKVKKYDSQGNFLLMWGNPGAGEGQFSILLPDEGQIAVDTHDNVYISDISNFRIQKFDSQGNFLTQWGTKGKDEGQFLEASDLAIDDQIQVYVGDYQSNYVQKFDENGKFLIRWGGRGQFSGIYSLALDPQGNVLVADERGILRKFDSNGKLLSEIPAQKLGNYTISLWNIARDGKGNLYIADQDALRIVVLDPRGKPLATWRGGETGAVSFNQLEDIAVDDQGNIYITDSGANLVQKFRLQALQLAG